MNNDNMNIEVNLLDENFVILDERTGGYSKKTKIQDMFNVCKQITLDKCRSKDEKTAWIDDFKNYSALDMKNFVEILHNYRFLEPNEHNINMWEWYHGMKWM